MMWFMNKLIFFFFWGSIHLFWGGGHITMGLFTMGAFIMGDFHLGVYYFGAFSLGVSNTLSPIQVTTNNGLVSPYLKGHSN